MAEITAAMVKQLRDRTQAPMGKCKDALVRASGDMDAAVDIILKEIKGSVAKAGKIAAEGAVAAAVSADGAVGAAVELNCQTDFVARGAEFKSLLKDLLHAAIAHKAGEVEALEAAATEGGSFKERIAEVTGRSGEKHSLRRVTLFTAAPGAVLRTYVHSNDRIAVLVEVSASSVTPAVTEFADDVTLQVASMSPRYLTRGDVDDAVVAKQREVFSGQMDEEDAKILNEPAAFIERVKVLLVERAKEEGNEPPADLDAAAQALVTEDEKFRTNLQGYQRDADKIRARNPQVREKILEGKVSKWLTEIVLLDQTSVKESQKTIGQLQKALGNNTAITRFARYEVGEGIEKAPTKDFAQEVAEMAAAAAKG